MTEAEWLATDMAEPMLESLGNRGSDRKFRLFACACARRLWGSMPDGPVRSAVEAAEEYADGQIDKKRLAESRTAVRSISWDAAAAAARLVSWDPLGYIAWHCCRGTIRPGACHVARSVSFLSRSGNYGYQYTEASMAVATIVREVFGNPFRPKACDRGWLSWSDGSLPRLATSIYDARTFDRLPILADALEDAGCTDRDILGHLRGPGPHVRGCWAVDLILGKS